MRVQNVLKCRVPVLRSCLTYRNVGHSASNEDAPNFPNCQVHAGIEPVRNYCGTRVSGVVLEDILLPGVNLGGPTELTEV